MGEEIIDNNWDRSSTCKVYSSYDFSCFSKSVNRGFSRVGVGSNVVNTCSRIPEKINDCSSSSSFELHEPCCSQGHCTTDLLHARPGL